MIAIDTSAVIGILQGESGARACMTVIENADALVMSAETLSELLIVSNRRGIGDQPDRFVRELGIEIDSLTALKPLDKYLMLIENGARARIRHRLAWAIALPMRLPRAGIVLCLLSEMILTRRMLRPWQDRLTGVVADRAYSLDLRAPPRSSMLVK